MPIQFLSGAPFWVWPLLFVLVFVGIKATRARSAPCWLIYSLPLLGILSLRAVNALPASGYIWVVFGLVYVIGAAVGFRYQKAIVLGKADMRVTLAGEWLTLALMMAVFWMNFVGGVLKVVAPALYSGSGFHIAFAGVAGLVAGIFLGRAVRVFTS